MDEPKYQDTLNIITRRFKELGYTTIDKDNYIFKQYRATLQSLSEEEALNLLQDLNSFQNLEIDSNPLTNSNKKVMKTPIQKIFFGCPGTGKSHQISNDIDGGIVENFLDIDKETHPENFIKTVFHPEYTYGDFMGKLMPLTNSDGKVEYNFYEGHFLKALAQAYKNIISRQENTEARNVVLVIDEINRGNSSAIFGTVFQLLDRREDGWSSYGINISDLEFRKLVELIGFEQDKDEYYKYGDAKSGKYLEEYQNVFSLIKIKVKNSQVTGSSIRIPPNLSIMGTMNTSDNSIYFMDNAFKRRWDWEYVDWDEDITIPPGSYGESGDGSLQWSGEWQKLVKNLNTFIKDNHNSVRGGRIEDMQIGYRFINVEVVTEQHIQNKLMFFIWDSVFNRDKKPLRKLLELKENELVTFGDFIKNHNGFVDKLLNYDSFSY